MNMDVGRSFWVRRWVSVICILLVYLPDGKAAVGPIPCQHASPIYIDPSVETNVTVDYQYTKEALEANVVIWNADPPTNSSFSNGTTIVEIIYLDETQPRNQTCRFLITIVELTPPECPDDVIEEIGYGLTSAKPTWPPATSPYGDVNQILYSKASGDDVFFLGATLVTAYFKDYMNVSCSFTVYIVSTPCQDSRTIYTDSFVGNSITVQYQYPQQESVTIVNEDPPPNSMFGNGTTMVNITYSVQAVNYTASCDFSITVIELKPPECPENVVQEIDYGLTSAKPSWPPATSPYSDVNPILYSKASGDDVFSLGATPVTAYFKDYTSTSCSFTVYIVSTPCQDSRTIYIDTSVGNSTTVQYQYPQQENVTIVSEDPPSNSLFGNGTTMVNITYFVQPGNYTASCDFSITAIELTPPECPENVIEEVGYGLTSAKPTWPLATSPYSDVNPILHSKTSGDDVFFLGATPVTAFFKDYMNISCSFTVYIVSTPCQDSRIIYFDSSVGNSTTVEYQYPRQENVTIVNEDPPSNSMFGNGTTMVNITYFVQAGNYTASCDFSITAIELTHPVCPENVTVESGPGNLSANVTWPSATSPYSDVYPILYTKPNGSSFDLGDNLVTAYLTNYTNLKCSFTVTVFVDAPPVLTCPDITQNTTVGQRTATVTWSDVVITDDYTSVSALVTNSTHGAMIVNMAYDGDPVSVTLTAEDERGNIGTCTFTVNVVDNEEPMWSSCPSNISVMTIVGTNFQNVSWEAPNVTDNSGKGPVLADTPGSPQLFSVGTWPVVYTATDDSGNVGTCEFYVTVTDGEAPEFVTCPDDINVSILEAQPSVKVVWEEPTFEDNSIQGPVTATRSPSSPAPGSRLAVGSYLIEYTAMDEAGNVAPNCSFTINVVAQTDTVELDGSLLLDIVRGIDGQFNPTADRLDALRDDLDDLFRISSNLAPDFVGIEIIASTFEINFQVKFRLHLTNPSYYNEEEIKQAFNSALTNGLHFATTNTIVPGNFDLYVKEFRGQFTLFQIAASPLTEEVDFLSCCDNPFSTQYLDLEARVNFNLWSTFSRLINFKLVKSLRYRSGSIIVPFTVTLSEDSTATTSQADTLFTESVDETSLEWMPGGQPSNLFLLGLTTPNVHPIEEVCPSSFVCLNGGTCSVLNSTFIYNHECSCPTGTTEETCGENTQLVLSRNVIIGIVVGVLALFLLLIICCCCFLFLSQRRRYKGIEYGRNAAPLVIMPRDNDFFYYPNPMMDRPGAVVTEMEESVEGPFFLHGGNDYRLEPPLPLTIEPQTEQLQIPRPVTLGPKFYHDYLGPISSPQQERSRRSHFRDTHMDRFLRGQNPDYEGRHYQRDGMLERVEDMKQRLYREFNY